VTNFVPHQGLVLFEFLKCLSFGLQKIDMIKLLLGKIIMAKPTMAKFKMVK
jgi:hypothetical protein